MAELDQLIVNRLRAPDYQQWRAKVRATGGCARPIRLAGHSALLGPDGTLIHHHSGQLLAPCGNRRASVCQACSTRYAADAFHLLRAGLAGGHKHIPTTVTTKPRAFLTLTAPSFGPVHTRRFTRTGKTIPCGCTEHHHPADPRVSTPIDPDGYDYIGAVLWQAHAGPLWHRFTIALRRTLATRLGVPGRDFAQLARLSYAKVAEYQRRGLVHFHAAVRIDGPDGPADPTPSQISAELLRDALTEAARSTALTIIRPDGTEMRLQWGAQLDIRDITPTAAQQIENHDGQISENRLAGYIAKYATKGTGKTEAADKPIRSEHDINHLHLTAHHERIIRTIWTLGGLPEYEHLNLRKWAHMLGFRGHFLTKSQQYSTTFTAIQRERQTHQIAQILAENKYDEDTPIVVINNWRLSGIGHRDEAERELAVAVAGLSTNQHLLGRY
jgi:hypothetical protein